MAATEPIRDGVLAKPHRPVYRMHRYFARRPDSVFQKLLEHYSRPGDVVLDPFMGGGVTVVEGVVQQRRVIGYDINPLAAFITRMEVQDVDLATLEEAQHGVLDEFQTVDRELFGTSCRGCGTRCQVKWFEYSAIGTCLTCNESFLIANGAKSGIGQWKCPRCGAGTRFSPQADTAFELMTVFYECARCGRTEVAPPCLDDLSGVLHCASELAAAEVQGLWIPTAGIPDCNMQRESALHKKGIVRFRQLFTDRHLLALGTLRELILRRPQPFRDWLLFSFSSALRYTNRMVTRNPAWRGNRPLEWAKPGFWLPPVHLEANVGIEFGRRCEAVLKGKRDYLSRVQAVRVRGYESVGHLVDDVGGSGYFVESRSATSLPLPDSSVDVVITDPPYGSYVHYADLSNFWSVWLAGVDGLGQTIDDKEEAVIARKRFPGAKTAATYQQLLERCFGECARVLRPGGYMVMTFHNREPRAWASLLIAAMSAGFRLGQSGIVFQDGVASYRHTAQSRREGSVVGDFILSFELTSVTRRATAVPLNPGPGQRVTEKDLVQLLTAALESGPLTPNELMTDFYLRLQPKLLAAIADSSWRGGDASDLLLKELDSIQLFDSHRRALLERHFSYADGKWHVRMQ